MVNSILLVSSIVISTSLLSLLVNATLLLFNSLIIPSNYSTIKHNDNNIPFIMLLLNTMIITYP